MPEAPAGIRLQDIAELEVRIDVRPPMREREGEPLFGRSPFVAIVMLSILFTST